MNQNQMLLKDKQLKIMEKEKILNLLDKESERLKGDKKYRNIKGVIELNKAEENVGIIRGEYYEGGKLEYSGSLVLPINDNGQNPNNVWNAMKVGENNMFGLTLDSRKKSLIKLIKNMVRNSFDDGKVQDFL